MGADQFHTWLDQAATALDWWSDAGVDMLVDDGPRDWLARPAAPAPASTTVIPPAATGGEPDQYEDFWRWRLNEGAPESEWGVALFEPEGSLDADLLVVVDQANGGTLIEGAEGALLDRILSAIGRSRGDICLAALAQARPLADTLAADVVPQLAARVSLLMRLTPAQTVILVGHTTVRALTATNDSPAMHRSHVINRTDKELRVGAIAHPRFMMKHPQVKRDAWNCLRGLIGGNG